MSNKEFDEIKTNWDKRNSGGSWVLRPSDIGKLINEVLRIRNLRGQDIENLQHQQEVVARLREALEQIRGEILPGGYPSNSPRYGYAALLARDVLEKK